MDLYLIRHTRPQVEPGLCYGRLDVPLAPTHAVDCAAVAARLPAVQALWSSPLTRCRILAKAISALNGIEARIDARLCEMNFGDWEGLRWEAVDRSRSERWTADYWNIAPPGGETYRELYERVGAVLAEILACDVPSSAVVMHAGPIRAALAHCLRSAPQRYPEHAVDYGGIRLLRDTGAGWRLEHFDD